MIESGKSLRLSRDTEQDLRQGSGVSVSRIFADEQEDAIFRKGKIIDSFRRALFGKSVIPGLRTRRNRCRSSMKRYSRFLHIPISGIAAELLVQCKPMTAKVYFDKALDASENTSAGRMPKTRCALQIFFMNPRQTAIFHP